MSGSDANTLQRDIEAVDTSRNGHRTDGPQYGHVNSGHDSATETTRAGVQFQKNKRKRLFSNRTKTGCQTCRKRKKKCDEAKPACNNCTRGGFVCAGYLLKTPWPESGVQKRHALLHSKQYYSQCQSTLSRTLVETCPHPQPSQSLEEASTRTNMVGDKQHTNTHISGTKPWAAPLLNRATNKYSGTVSPSEAHQSFQEQESSPPDPSTMIPPSHQAQNLRDPPPAIAARLAIQQQRNQSPILECTLSLLQNQVTEKDKMLSGVPYDPSAPLLVDEREKCKFALWRFNNAISTGADRNERIRRFQDVLGIQDKSQSQNKLQPKPIGRLGTDSWVETPFGCEFGYNIQIGNNVEIDTNCTIADAGTVTIGDRSVLGENVCIYTSYWNGCPRDGPGLKRTKSAMEVVIEEDVIIEDSVVILAGTRIGKGSRVAAGSLVARGQLKFEKDSIVCGNPAMASKRKL